MDDVDRLWVGYGVGRSMAVDADAAFAVLADVGAIPLWSPRLAGWIGPTKVTVREPRARRFAFVARAREDGSYAEWRWHVAEHAEGCVVRVGWVLRPVGVRARLGADRLQDRRLRAELPAALERLEAVAGAITRHDVAGDAGTSTPRRVPMTA
jgi:hypothetical protein